MIDATIGTSEPKPQEPGNNTFASAATDAQRLAQVQAPYTPPALPPSPPQLREPNALEVGACRAGKVLQGVGGVAETALGTVVGMGGIVTTVLGAVVTVTETPFMGVEGKEPFWGPAVASAGLSGIGVGTWLGADGLTRIGNQFTGPACNAPRF